MTQKMIPRRSNNLNKRVKKKLRKAAPPEALMAALMTSSTTNVKLFVRSLTFPRKQGWSLQAQSSPKIMLKKKARRKMKRILPTKSVSKLKESYNRR